MHFKRPSFTLRKTAFCCVNDGLLKAERASFEKVVTEAMHGGDYYGRCRVLAFSGFIFAIRTTHGALTLYGKLSTIHRQAARRPENNGHRAAENSNNYKTRNGMRHRKLIAAVLALAVTGLVFMIIKALTGDTEDRWIVPFRFTM